jgi:hypothetical protein
MILQFLVDGLMEYLLLVLEKFGLLIENSMEILHRKEIILILGVFLH